MNIEFDNQKVYYDILNKANRVKAIAETGVDEYVKVTLLNTYPDDITTDELVSSVLDDSNGGMTFGDIEVHHLCFCDDLNLVMYEWLDGSTTYGLSHKYKDMAEFSYINDQVIEHPELGYGYRVLCEDRKEYVYKTLKAGLIEFKTDIFDCYVDDTTDQTKLVVYSRKWAPIEYSDMASYIIAI